MRDAFGLKPFVIKDVASVLPGLSYSALRATIRRFENKGEIKQVATKGQLMEFLPIAQCHDYYTFNLDLKEDKFLDSIDPVPFDERSLDVQLFGDALKRYQEIRERIFGGCYWEQRENE